MPLFSRNKSKKVVAGPEKQQQQQQQQPPSADSKKPPYRHTPKHAAADAIGNNGSTIAADNEKRVRDAKKRHTLAAPAMSRGLSQAPGSAGARGPHQSTYMVGAEPSVPPVPMPPNFSNFGPQSSLASTSSQRKTYFGGEKQQQQQQQQHPAASFDSPVLGNPKMQVAARDRGFFGPSPSQDSGYGSALHSRSGSISSPTTDSTSMPLLPQNNIDFLPSMSLTEALSLEPAFSEKSYSDDQNTAEPHTIVPEPKTIVSQVKQSAAEERQRNYLRKKSNENFSRPYGDAGSVKSSKSSKTIKHARFEESKAEPMPQSQHDWTVIRGGPNQIEHPPRVESRTIPVRPPRPLESLASSPEHEAVTDWRPHLPKSPPPMAPMVERQPSFARAHRASSPVPIPGSQFLGLDRIASSEEPATLPSPSLSILEGLKVNKRGRILDEEGEPIGELVEGDIMDCVRQKANANGEVLDEYGAVVGRVQTLPRAADRTMSPGPTNSRQHDYFQSPFVQQRMDGSPYMTPVRPASAGPMSFPNVFQAQQYSWPTQQYSTSYAGDNTHRAQPQARLPAIAPLDTPGSEFIVELDASDIKPQAMIEHEALMDLSDIFLPTSKALLALEDIPSIPDRSPLRPATPSSTGSRTANTTTSEHSASSSRTSQDLALDQHIAAIKLQHLGLDNVDPPKDEMAPQQVRNSATPAPLNLERPVYKPVDIPPPKLSPIEPVPAPPRLQSHVKSVPSMTELSQMLKEPSSPPRSQSTPPAKVEEPSKPAFVPMPIPKPSPLLRSKSEASRSPSFPSAKPGAQPPMPSLPRALVPQPPATPPPENGSLEAKSPFAYKGDIPAADGAAPGLAQLPPNRAQNTKSPPPLPSFPRAAFTSNLPASPFTALNSAPLGSGGPPAPPAGPRRMATMGNLSAGGATLGMQRPGMKPRHTFHSPLVRSPLASHETTPPESDGSANSDDGKADASTATKAANTAAAASYLAAARSRAPSMKSNAPSVRSVATTKEKPRTYFTHTGRVTVAAGEMTPAAKAAEASQRSATTTPDAETQSVKEKKSRFSMWNKKEKK